MIELARQDADHPYQARNQHLCHSPHHS
jgi:hypothetical protein